MTQDHDPLERYFEAARDARPEVSPEFLARLTDQAQALQPAAPAAWWRRFLDEFGGWPAMGGLVAASAIGFYVGFAAPELVEGDATEFTELGLIGDDFFFEEG